MKVAVGVERGRVAKTSADGATVVPLGDAVALLACDGLKAPDASAFELVAAVARAVLPRAGHLAPAVRVDLCLRLADRLLGEDHPGGPGCTATLALALPDPDRAHMRVVVGWVGDSRAHLVRGGVVGDRTKDHRAARSAPPEGRRSLGALGRGAGAADAHVPTEQWEVRPGDVLLVCTDGLSDLVSAAELGRLASGDDPAGAVAALVAAALDHGGTDNLAVAVAILDGVALDTPADPGADAVLAGWRSRHPDLLEILPHPVSSAAESPAAEPPAGEPQGPDDAPYVTPAPHRRRSLLGRPHPHPLPTEEPLPNSASMAPTPVDFKREFAPEKNTEPAHQRESGPNPAGEELSYSLPEEEGRAGADERDRSDAEGQAFHAEDLLRMAAAQAPAAPAAPPLAPSAAAGPPLALIAAAGVGLLGLALVGWMAFG